MKKRIGDILMEMGFIDGDQLQMALLETKKTGNMLGDVLLRLGWVTEEDLQMAIAVQSGAKILDTETVAVDHNLMSRIPIDFVNQNGIFPFAINDGLLKAATSNPFDVVARDRLARISGNRVETYIAPKDWIAKSIEIYYNTAQTIDDEINAITYGQSSDEASEEKRIIRLSGLLIDKGFVLGASDIHIVPDSNLVRVYYRIDGVLHQTYLFSKSFQQALATRFKIMADVDISNPNIPHDGRIKYESNVGRFDIRVSTFPTQLGETVVMRLLIYNKVVGDLKKLGLEPDEVDIFKHNGIEPPAEVAKSTGCDNCFQSGYRGRTGVYEVIQVDRNIEKLIFAGALHREIEDVACEAGTSLMFKQALKKVAKHQTSIEEVMRVIVDYA